MAKKSSTPRPAARAQQRGGALDLPVSYKTVFWVAVALTVLPLACSVYLATRPAEMQTDTLKKVVDTCDSTWKTGFGVIIGLLGGKLLP
jgi:hypothetical protein